PAILLFRDHNAASTLLERHRSDGRLLTIALYDKSGKVFHSWLASAGAPQPRAEPGPAGIVLSGDQADLFEPVRLNGEVIGTVYLHADLSEAYTGLHQSLIISCGLAALGILLTIFISTRLQGVISKPILDLAETARCVSVQKNYYLRAVKSSDDEVGAL